MKNIFSPLVWLFVAFMAGQGAMPGLVVCLGEDGHVEVEQKQGGCCDPSRQLASGQAGDVVATSLDSATDDSCGSCTDSPLSLTTAFRIKSESSDTACAEPLAHAQRFHTPVVLDLKPLVERRSVVTNAMRIPIVTTTLLI